MKKIVQCVPNFSEGRRRHVVDAIVAEIASVPETLVLDVELDRDHNRSVVTFIGSPLAVEDAALKAVGKAAELIDLRNHKGEHPRMGATDVVPFVPIMGVTMAECVEIARRVGEKIARTYHIPVYLYESAATRQDREDLAHVRKGEFEGIRDEIATNPDRKPDFGEARIHESAGATAVGARMPLVAFNVNLATDDITIAKRIAKAVRGRSGGLRYAKALGFEIKQRGITQVSMNLVNYEKTPIHRAFELVRLEAERYGVNVVGSEIVGLVPQQALLDSADYFLRLENFTPAQILESRLQEKIAAAGAASTGGWPAFVDAVFESTPTPGGGSVAALAGSLAAALAGMVAQLTLSSKKHRDRAAEMEDVRTRARSHMEVLKSRVTEDAEAFDRVIKAMKMPRLSDDQKAQRHQAMQEAFKQAAAVPLATLEECAKLVSLIDAVASRGNQASLSDAGMASLMCMACAEGAAMNVLINLASIEDIGWRARTRERVLADLEKVTTGLAPILSHVKSTLQADSGQ
ncbi:MAG TPA: glutamate formimidoyltransferase [bacterium]|nr:glutamate formimidoyltransferase [bacterium]